MLSVPTNGGKPVHITGAPGPEGGSDSGYVAYVFVFSGIIIICLLYKLTLFIPSHSHTATKSQSFPFGVKIFRRSALAWGPDKLFSPWPEPPVGRPMCCGWNNTLWQYMCL